MDIHLLPWRSSARCPHSRGTVVSNLRQSTSAGVLAAWLVFIGLLYATRPDYSSATVIAGTILATALTMHVGSAQPMGLPWAAAGLACLGSAVAILAVAGFGSMLTAAQERLVVVTMSAVLISAVGLAAAGLTRTSVMVAAVAFTAYAALNVHQGPVAIDVYHFSNQAADMVLRNDVYTGHWTGLLPNDTKAVREGYPYLPMNVVLLAPFRWLFGDVRWGLVACLAAVGWIICRGAPQTADRRRTALLAVLATLAPGCLVLVENAWNEPLVFALLASSLIAFERRAGRTGVVLLALSLATKQHVWLLVPALAFWRPAGWRHVSQAVAVAVGLCLPWILASPSAFWHGVVELHLANAPRPDADTLYIWALRSGWTTGLGAGGAVILACTMTYAAAQLRRPTSHLADVAAASALILLVGSLVNRQAFINQYWLTGVLTLMALAAQRPTDECPTDALSFEGDRRRLSRARIDDSPKRVLDRPV